MTRILATSVLLLLPTLGCAMDVDDRAQPPQPAAEDVAGSPTENEPPVGHYDEDDSDYSDSDPCAGQTGVTYHLDGRQFFVPADCNEHWFDMGDPPPEQAPDSEDDLE